MDRVKIPHTDIEFGGKKFPSPAWWGGEGRVLMRCACGEMLMLDHDVAPNGDVEPSIWHDTPECGWHVMGTLEDWRG